MALTKILTDGTETGQTVADKINLGFDATDLNTTDKEDDLGDPTTDGDVLSSTILGVRSWVVPTTLGKPIATQAEVNAGTVTDKIVTPETLTGYASYSYDAPTETLTITLP